MTLLKNGGLEGFVTENGMNLEKTSIKSSRKDIFTDLYKFLPHPGLGSKQLYNNKVSRNYVQQFMAYILLRLKKNSLGSVFTLKKTNITCKTNSKQKAAASSQTRKKGSSWSGQGTHVRIKCMLQKDRRLIINICDSDRKSTRRK